MFNYQTAFVRERAPRSPWVTKDLSNEKMVDINHDYLEVILELTNPLYVGSVNVNVKDIPTYLQSSTSSLTLTEFLASLGVAGLPLSDFRPNTNYTWANWADAFQAGYDVDLVHPTFSPDVPVNREDKTDLRIEKEGVDPRVFFDECLVTVNGLLHRTNFVGESVHVIDGGKSNMVSKKNQIGILHLGNLGKVTCVPICKRDISQGLADRPNFQMLSEVAYIKVNEDVGSLEGKSVLLSIGGYLLLPENDDIHRVADGIYKLEVRNQPWIQRFFDAKSRISMSCVDGQLSKSTVNPNQVVLEEFYSDESLINLFTLSQSFFIVIDTPSINFEKEYIEFDGLPGRYISHVKPTYPLITGFGAMSEYWHKWEYDRYVLSTLDMLLPNYAFETTDWRKLISVDDSRVSAKPDSLSKGYLLKIGKQTN